MVKKMTKNAPADSNISIHKIYLNTFKEVKTNMERMKYLSYKFMETA
jgi:hypothetical protein